VGDHDVARGTFTVNPMCLDDGEVEYLIERIAANLA
jgi:hypothetical protein